MIRRLLGAYEPWKVALLRQIVRPGMTCVDVGANNGFFSFLMARCMNDQGRVLAFEPEHQNRLLLERGRELNGYRSIQSYELALADAPGTLTFFAGKQSGWGSLVRRPGEHLDDKNSFDVTASTLDAILEQEGLERVDIMKVDVQGAEFVVFCGDIQGHPADPRRAATNPTALIDVLSESTAEYDRGEKFQNYKSIPTLQEYVLVHQTERKLEIFSRKDDWACRVVGSGEFAKIPSVDVTLAVDEMY